MLELTGSEPARPSSPRRKGFVRAGLLTLLIALALSLVYFYRSPTPFIQFYLMLTQRIDIGDGGLISHQPCGAPCAFGIQAGETRLEQVVPLLKKYGLAKCMTEPSISWILVSCGIGRFNVQADTGTGIVNGIWFYPNTSITVGEIIAQYGEPDFVSLDFQGYLEQPAIQMNLYWDSIRMLVRLPDMAGNSYIINKDTRILSVDYSDDQLYQDSSEVEFGSFYRQWSGYGDYQP